jgi:hypothetical protein
VVIGEDDARARRLAIGQRLPRVRVGREVDEVARAGDIASATGNQLLCWGENVEGELGNGTTTSTTTPTPVLEP